MPRQVQPTHEERQAAMVPLFDAQTRLVEALEGILRCDDYAELDGLLGDAMRKIARTRSDLRELDCKRKGLITIGATG